MRILLVEDDPQLGDGIRAGLQQADYVVDWLRDGLSALHSLEIESFDMVVLDLGLPKMDGISVLEKIRTSGNDVPVLILTARDTVSDRIKGLDSGADDYLAKPFDLDELCARIRALNRRHSGRASSLIKYRDITLDPMDRSLRKEGKDITLSTREFSILQIFLENTGRILSRERIEESLFGWDEALESNATEVHIHHLRKKLGKELIVTIRGVGYMIPKEGG